MSTTHETRRPARPEIPAEDFRIKIEPMGDRPLGYVAYNLTVSTPRWAYYEHEVASYVWGKGISDPRIVKRIKRLTARLSRRLQHPLYDGRLGDFTSV